MNMSERSKPWNARWTYLLFILGLVVWMSLGSTKSVRAGGPWYVDVTNGNDGNDCLSWATACKTIAAAIAKAGSGDTINVAAGVYDESINLDNKSGLSLIGIDKNTVIIKPSTALCWNIASYGCSRKVVFRVVNSTNVALKNMTIDMDLVKDNNMYGVLYWDSTGELDNNIIKNASLPDASGYYDEIGSYFRAPSYTNDARAQVNVSNNTYIDAGRVAILAHDYVHAIISGNTLYKTFYDFGYAMEIGSTSTGDISNNVIYGYDTPAQSDNSQSAGIYIENAFTGPAFNNIISPLAKPVSITSNEIYNCQWALYIGNEFDEYAGNVDIIATVSNNYLHDNLDGAVVLADEDKEFGSSVTAAFIHNTLSNNGDYGYYFYTNGDGDITSQIIGDQITGHNVGVDLYDGATGSSGSSYDISVQWSNLQDNTTYGIQNEYAGTTINAERNWWGCSGGPGTSGCSDISGDVDYTPWLTAPVIEAVVDTLSNGENLSLPSGKVSATFSSGSGGSATVYLATYGSNPGSNVGSLIGAGNTFHDLYVTNLTDPNATLTVQVAAGAVGQVLRYWDGTAWKTVHSNDWSIPVADGTPKITVVFGPNSRPRLVDLTGTPIVSSSPEAVAIQFSGSQVVQGQPITAKVVAKSTNLYGVELHLTFDASKLQVGSVSLGGDLLAESIAQNVYNNTVGTIDFAFSQQAPTPPQSGDDIEVATLTFYGGSSAGSATVGYASTPSSIFSDPDGVALAEYPGSLDAQPGNVTVIQSATVSGVVLLQGRSNHAGANISTTTGGSFQTVTASNGAFALTGLTPNTVSYTIKASLPGYLDAIRAAATYNSGNNNLPTITLVGGDTTHDQQINILDLALIGGRFGSSDFQADLNADGKVNILDLTMAGANFGLSGPTVW